MSVRHRLAVIAVAAACDPSPPAVPASGGAQVAAPAGPSRELAALPGAIWFVDDEAMHRIAGGARTEVARGVAPSAARLGDAIVAIRGGSQLERIDPSGAASPIGRPGAALRDPVAARDGSWIAVAGTFGGRAGLYRIDVATGAATWLADGDQPAALGGDALAFTSRRDGDAELYRIGTSGGDPVRLTRSPGDDTRPTPSPDGATIAYVSQRDGGARIALIDADGGHPRRLTDRAEPGRSEREPAWSPDGALIAYVVARGSRTHVWLRDLATGREQDLTPEGILDREPCFSPDGRWVAVSRTRGHDIDLWALPTGVGEPVRITTGRHADREPRWR